ncbi:MAG: molybdopterin molybdotransferase MoeA [Synergistaceae bacterium]|nr:molybdopterin molybdotransferase MoeA [Synergistaceae bacterium]
MITLEQATETLLNEIRPITRTRLISLEKAIGRISVEDVHAPIDMPPFDRSPLDGYAQRAADIAQASRDKPVKLKAAAEIPAGVFWDGTISPGSTARIMTGSMIPKGADCVVKQEDTDDGEQEVCFYVSVKSQENICFKGEDIKKGTRILSCGSVVSYAHLAVLASVGHSRVLVRDRVKAGLLSTGDELTLLGEPLEQGKIYNSNLFMLAGRMENLGADVISLYNAKDDVLEVCRIIEREIDGVDIFFTTGGVSVGRRDIMHAVLSRLGATILFWKISLKPGTPVLAAIYREKLLLCLSGNPFAAMTNFELLGRPSLHKLSGDLRLKLVRVKGIMDDAFSKRSPERRFVRAVYENGRVKIAPHSHSSGALLSLLGCNALIDIEGGSPGLNPGDNVELVLL